MKAFRNTSKIKPAVVAAFIVFSDSYRSETRFHRNAACSPERDERVQESVTTWFDLTTSRILQLLGCPRETSRTGTYLVPLQSVVTMEGKGVVRLWQQPREPGLPYYA